MIGASSVDHPSCWVNGCQTCFRSASRRVSGTGRTLAMVQVGMPPLPLLVFVVGTGSLGAEIAAVRLLAPYFGASTVVWANTIGVVLVALSVGYWLGGKWADRNPTMRGLCLVTLAAASLLAVVPFAADPLLDLAVEALDDISAGAFFGSLVAVLVLVKSEERRV